jgi:molybdopterin-guanine dinucleotide biosynthesis protein A
VLVAVLAGGAGTRLGGDKATVELAGRPLISYPLQAARAAGLEAIVVAKRTTPLPALTEQVVHEPEHPRHPLCGVLAALRFATEDPGVDAQGSRSRAVAVITVACDMPFLTGPLLRWLAQRDGATIAEAGGRLEPMLARHLTGDAASLSSGLEQGLSLREACIGVGARVLPEAELRRFGDPARLLFNVNEAADLVAARRWLEA